jgi:hypothetical protein
MNGRLLTVAEVADALVTTVAEVRLMLAYGHLVDVTAPIDGDSLITEAAVREYIKADPHRPWRQWESWPF